MKLQNYFEFRLRRGVCLFVLSNPSSLHSKSEDQRVRVFCYCSTIVFSRGGLFSCCQPFSNWIISNRDTRKHARFRNAQTKEQVAVNSVLFRVFLSIRLLSVATQIALAVRAMVFVILRFCLFFFVAALNHTHTFIRYTNLIRFRVLTGLTVHSLARSLFVFVPRTRFYRLLLPSSTA